MSDRDALDALRRHLASPERRRFTTFPGGIRFLEGGRVVAVRDEQVLAVLSEMAAEKRRRRAFDRLLQGSRPSDDPATGSDPVPDREATAALRRLLTSGRPARFSRLGRALLFQEGGRAHRVTDEEARAVLRDLFGGRIDLVGAGVRRDLASEDREG